MAVQQIAADVSCVGLFCGTLKPKPTVVKTESDVSCE